MFLGGVCAPLSLLQTLAPLLMVVICFHSSSVVYLNFVLYGGDKKVILFKEVAVAQYLYTRCPDFEQNLTQIG